MPYANKIKNQTVSVLVGVFTAVILIVLLALVLAIICSIFSLNTSVIKPINQFIKVLSTFSACLLSVRGSAGYLKGFIIGVLTALVSCLVMSFFGGSFWDGLFLELLFGGAIGCISGIIAVNLVAKN